MSAAAPGKLGLFGTDPSAGATYPSVPASKIACVNIFPPVGIARFGDSQVGYFLAPEVPGCTDPPAGITSFRGSDQGLLRQAVRFRVYAYDADNNPLGEVNSQNGYNLNWTVHVANKKAAHTIFQGRFDTGEKPLRNPLIQPTRDFDTRSKLIVDPGPQSISTTGTDFVNLKGTFQGSTLDGQLTTNNDVYLGQLQVDDVGHLIFIGGSGRGHSVQDPCDVQPTIVSEFDSVDWIDTGCDGSVSVHVTGDIDMKSGYVATAVCAPPNFAWGVNMPTSLYNIMEDVYWRRGQPPTQDMIDKLQYDFVMDIWPALQAATLISWTNTIALQGHGPITNGHFASSETINILQNGTLEERTALKTRIFDRLRIPDYELSQADAKYMPRLSGDSGDMPEPGTFFNSLPPNDPQGIPAIDVRRFTALTWLQYERFGKWKDDTTPLGPWPPTLQSKIEDVPLQSQTDYLARASMDSTVGDPLFPGIEMYWIAKCLSTYNLDVAGLQPPFRVNYAPEDVTPAPGALLPGHLTWGLSIPWQCDFYLCNTHWWPAIRPDDAVRKITYDIIMGECGTTQQFNTAVGTRQSWTRGFRADISMGQGRTTTDIPWYPSTDMVRYWSYLGIVRRYERQYQAGTRVAWVENERLDF